MSKKLKQQFLAVFLFVIYFLIRFLFEDKLALFGPYGTYYFEFFYVAVVGYYYRKRWSLKPVVSKKWAMIYAAALLAGLLVEASISPLHLVLPWDFHSTEVLIFILFIGPVLEELIFRMALWELIAEVVPHSNAPWFLTSLLFALSHLYVFIFVDPVVQAFVLYQSCYTLFLGLACGWARMKVKTLAPALKIHFAFNAGFVIGSFLLK